MTRPTHRPLVWRPQPEGRPAALLRTPTRAEAWREFCDLIREREREHREDLEEAAAAVVGFALAMVAEQDRLEADVRASLEALAESEAMAREAAALTALEKVCDALVDFEVRAQRDPAAAARALCRWLQRMRRGTVGEAPTVRPAGASRTQPRKGG